VCTYRLKESRLRAGTICAATRAMVTPAKLASGASSNLLTPEEVAEQIGLSVETLAQWRSQKKGIPFVKVSRNCVRYRKSDLDDWIEERIVRTPQEPVSGRRRN